MNEVILGIRFSIVRKDSSMRNYRSLANGKYLINCELEKINQAIMNGEDILQNSLRRNILEGELSIVEGLMELSIHTFHCGQAGNF
ncbi:MAG: hypothetical protein KF753_12890 [Caldilineaceae bacterium]|nr:hypothetical protein [Caldilineaceae bacterium]